MKLIAKNEIFAQSIKRWLSEFFINLKAIDSSDNTITSYKTILGKFYDYSVELGDNTDLRSIKQMNIQFFFEWLKENNITGKDLALSSKKTYLKVVQSFFNFIAINNDDLIHYDLLFKNIRLSGKKLAIKEEFFTKEEQNKIFSYLNDKIEDYQKKMLTNKPNYFKTIRTSLIIKLGIYAGLRISESLNLKFYDLQYNDNRDFFEISVLGKGNKEGIAFIKAEHIIFELDELAKLYSPSSRNFNDFSAFNSYIFVSKVEDYYEKNQTPLTRIAIYRLLAREYKRAGVDKSGTHILRHTFAMNLLNNGVDITIISKALRHSDIKTTMVYANANDEMIMESLR